MIYLGIDYGRIRIGIALSDEEGRIAFPKAVFQNNGFRLVVSRLHTTIQREKISRVIVGLPRALDGRETEQTKVVRRFAGKLRQNISIPVEFEDERLTTRIAARSTSRGNVDAAAAALILQTYLDRNKSK